MVITELLFLSASQKAEKQGKNHWNEIEASFIFANNFEKQPEAQIEEGIIKRFFILSSQLLSNSRVSCLSFVLLARFSLICSRL